MSEGDNIRTSEREKGGEDARGSKRHSERETENVRVRQSTHQSSP